MSESNMKNVDEAIAKAQAAKEAQRAKMKNSEENTTGSREKVSKADREEAKKAALEAREAKKLTRALVREQKKAEREQLLAERKLTKEAKRTEKALARAKSSQEHKPAHMTKVEKAAARLPSLSDDLQEHVANLTEMYSVGEISRVIAHLQHSNRAKSTLQSVNVSFNVGEVVRIVASEADPSLIGQVGTVTEMRKIRVLLNVEGMNRPVYLFASDCESLNEEDAENVHVEEPTEEEVTGTDVNEEGFLSIEEDSEEDATGTDG